MDGKEFILNVERDAILIAAIRDALSAMELTNGCGVTMAGVQGTLHFERPIEKLKMALQVLSIDGSDFSEFRSPQG